MQQIKINRKAKIVKKIGCPPAAQCPSDMILEGIRETGEGVIKEISCKFYPNGRTYGL